MANKDADEEDYDSDDEPPPSLACFPNDSDDKSDDKSDDDEPETAPTRPARASTTTQSG